MGRSDFAGIVYSYNVKTGRGDLVQGKRFCSLLDTDNYLNVFNDSQQ